MKRVITIIAALMPCAMAMAGQKADTLLNVAKADTVVIIDNSSELQVNTVNEESRKSIIINVEPVAERVLKIEKNKSKKTTKTNEPAKKAATKAVKVYMPSKNGYGDRWDGIIGGLNFGMVNAVDGPACMDHQMTKSWEISMLYILGVRYKLHKWSSLNLGLGITGRNLKVGNGMRYLYDGDNIVPSTFPEGAVDTSADIYTFSIDMPLLFRQYLSVKLDGRHRMSVILGGILNFNTYSSVSAHYSMPDNRRYDEKLDRKYQRPVTGQLMGGIYFNNWLGAYVKYMPVEPMKPAALSYKPLSVGLMLSF